MGAFSAPYIVVSQLSVAAVSIVLCVLNACAAALSLLLHETAGHDLDERDESLFDESRNPLQEELDVSEQ